MPPSENAGRAPRRTSPGHSTARPSPSGSEDSGRTERYRQASESEPERDGHQEVGVSHSTDEGAEPT